MHFPRTLSGVKMRIARAPPHRLDRAKRLDPQKFNNRREKMPNIKSAKKRVKVIETKTLQNKMFKNQMRTVVKKYNAALASGNKEEAAAAYKAAVKKIDQAVAKGILHKNNAAHKKSEFTLALNKLA